MESQSKALMLTTRSRLKYAGYVKGVIVNGTLLSLRLFSELKRGKVATLPCDSVAVISARINANTLSELILSEQAREALREYISTLTKANVQVSVSSGTLTYEIDSLNLTISVSKTGVQSRSYSSRYVNQDTIEKISAVANEIALASVKMRMVERIKSRYIVKSDVQVDGARMLQISL